jgi:hypothetical protein
MFLKINYFFYLKIMRFLLAWSVGVKISEGKSEMSWKEVVRKQGAMVEGWVLL